MINDRSDGGVGPDPNPMAWLIGSAINNRSLRSRIGGKLLVAIWRNVWPRRRIPAPNRDLVLTKGECKMMAPIILGPLRW